MDKINELGKALEKLKAQREKENEDIRNVFDNNTEEMARERRDEKEYKTSWEMLDKMDELKNRLSVEAVEDYGSEIKSQKNSMRSLLISNEAFIKNNYFDRLGGYFLDILSEESEAGYYKAERDGKKIIILREMRSVLRKTNFWDKLQRNNFKSLAMLFIIVFVFTWYFYGGLFGFGGETIFEYYLLKVVEGIPMAAFLTGFGYLIFLFFFNINLKRFRP